MAATRLTKLSWASLVRGVLLIAASLLLSVTQAKAETEKRTTPLPDEPIDVPAYMALNVGDVFTYDDGARAEITRTVELDWLDNVTAYEKVWTINPNPEITDARYYFILSGDSLFLASAHMTHDGVADYAKFDPPALMGTANTIPGDTLTTVRITYYGVEEDTGLPNVEDDSSIVQVVVNRSGPVSVPYGTFEDCITMTVILMPSDEEEAVELLNVILAKGVGIIQGMDVLIATESAPVHSMTDFQPGTTPQPDEPIDVPAYMPLNIGDVFTYDDGARAEITGTVELDWLDNVTAYEKVWTVNPNPQITDVSYYFISRGDSLFMASLHFIHDGISDYAKLEPPILMGTANTTPGDTLNTVGTRNEIDDATGLPGIYSSFLQVIVNRSVPVNVPSGTFEDCISMIFLEEEDGEMVEVMNLILAKGIGIIHGMEWGIASESAPVHSMTDFQPGTTPQPDEPIDVSAYMPLNVGDVFTYDDGSRAEITRTVELDWLDNATAYEKVWTVNPNPQMTDVKYNFISRGDSLFWASLHFAFDSVYYLKNDPPALMGTANTTPGDTFSTNTMGITFDDAGMSRVYPAIVHVVVNRSGPVSVPYGTFEDCITMKFIEVHLDDGEKEVFMNLVLAKGIGIIQGNEAGIASESAPVHSLVDYQPGTTPEPEEPIDVPAYMPLNIGDVFTYDDGSRAEITRTVELDWLDNATAYEKAWTINPNPQMTDVRGYYITSGDSLFLASLHGTSGGVADHAKFDPPVLLGTANTTPGDTLTTVGVVHGVIESSGLPEVDSSIVQVVVNRSGPVSVPYGTLEDCITMTITLSFIYEEDTLELKNVILAKGVGIIYGREEGIATASAPVHSLTDFQPGTTPVLTPDISLSITSIDMGEVIFGSQATALFSIVNSGNAPLAIDSITSDNSAFTVNPTSASINPGDSLNITIIYTPSAIGSDSASITLASDDPDSPTIIIPLSVNVILPESLPVVTAIFPSYLYQEAVDSVITITGGNFSPGAKVTISGGGILVTETGFIDSLNLSAKVTVSAGAVSGNRDVSVVNPDGETGTGGSLLEVRELPKVFEIKPFYLEQGTDSLYVTLNGKGFTEDFSASFSGTGINVIGQEYKGPTQVILLLAVDSGAEAGRRDLTLTVSGLEVVVSAALEVRSNQPPAISVAADWTVNEGEQLTFVVHASDPEGGPLTYQTGTLPAGATFQGVAFTWRPDYEQAGSYSVQFTVADQLGATDRQTVNITVANTNRAPKFYKLSNQKVTSGQVMSFTIVAGDPDGESLTLSTTGLPTGAVITPASDTTFSFSWTPTDDDAGTFRTEFSVTDPAGATARQSIGLTVDVPARQVNLPPVFVDTVSLLQLDEGAVLDLEVAAVDSNLTEPVTYIQSLPQNADFDPVTSRFTFRPDYRQAGSYTFLFIATDGSLTASRELTVVVAETDVVPVMPPLEEVEISEGERFLLTVAAVDSGGDALTYEADSLPPGASLDPLTGMFLFTPDFTQQGEYSIVLRAKDPAGNFAEDTLSLSVKNTNQAPALTYIADQIVQTNDTLMLLVSAVDPDGDSLSFGFTSSQLAGSLFDPASQIFTFVAGSGTDTLEGVFIVSDEAGLADSQQISISVVATDNQPPVIGQLAARRFFSEGDTVSIQVSATDPEGDNLSFGIANTDKLPEAMRQIGADGLYRFVADYTLAGRYEVIFQVSDGKLNSTVQVEIDIENVNRPPVIETVGDRQVAEGEKLVLSFAISDPDGDVVSSELNGLPRGASFDKQADTFSFTPDYDQAGAYYLGISVSDGQASATDNFTLVVANTNRAPLLRRVMDPEVVEGQLIEFELEADDPDGDSAWVVIDTSRVPFLGDAMQKIARLRNRRSFFFDTAKLIDVLRIPSAVLNFYAQDEHGARSQEEIVDIAIIRKALAQINDLPPGLEKKLDMLEEYGVGVQIAIQNNSDQDLTVDLEVSERSGRVKRGKRESESLNTLLAGLMGVEDKVKDEDPYADYRYTYLSSSGDESAFYGVRRGWGLDLSQLPGLTGITAIFTYQDEDLPLEIEGFDESNLRLYGLDTLSDRFVKIENAVVDTDSNTVTFQITDFSVVDYTLGVEVSPEAAADLQTLNVEILVDNVTIETGYTTDTTGPYVIRAYASEEALVSHARLFYRIDGTGGDYQAVDMSKIEGERYGYEAQIEGLPEEGTIRYYVEMFVNFEMVSSPLNPEEQTYELIVGSFLIGDVSGNGIVNIFDLLDLLKVLSGSLESTPASDCDQNGVVNIFDLLELLRILGGR